MEILEPIFYSTGKETLQNNCLSINIGHPEVVPYMQNQICGTHVHDDIVEPIVQVTDIQWQHRQEEIDFKPRVVNTLTCINGDLHPVDKIFDISWSTEEEQSTTWSQQSSFRKNFEYEAVFPGLDYTVKLTYDHACSTSTTSVLLSSKKSLQVTMAPRKTTIGQLVLLASEITELPFIVTIKFSGANETSSEYKLEGIWRGTLYKLSSSDINVHETELGIM